MLKTFKNAPSFEALQTFAYHVQNSSEARILKEFAKLQANPLFASKGWKSAFQKLSIVLNSCEAQFAIFAEKGNSKLGESFVAFSTLPGVTCPGAGECINFCYSYSAWRYPSAFCRQVQNAFFMRFHRGAIFAAFQEIANSREEFDFRLYVDGDFASELDIQFWMDLLTITPKARAYGYSKSFEHFLNYVRRGNVIPPNYMLNISSGHNADNATFQAIRNAYFVRGEFRAISIGAKVKSNDHGTKWVNDALRSSSPEKVFPCPGKCGSCTGAGHACGLPQMKGRVIAIAIH